MPLESKNSHVSRSSPVTEEAVFSDLNWNESYCCTYCYNNTLSIFITVEFGIVHKHSQFESALYCTVRPMLFARIKQRATARAFKKEWISVPKLHGGACVCEIEHKCFPHGARYSCRKISRGVIGVPIETCVTVVLPQQVAVRDSQRRACFVAEKQNDVQTGHD